MVYEIQLYIHLAMVL